MAKIDNWLTFVKDQVAVQERLARKYDEDDYRRSLHFKTASSFSDLARFLSEIQRRGTQDVAYLNRGDTPQKRILITYEQIKDAPEELLKELNLTDADRQELLVEYLIAQAGGILSLDQIILELFERTKEVPKRAALTQRFFRMVSKGMIYNVPGKKGVYSTYELTEAEAKKMFGQFDSENSEEIPVSSSQASAPAPVQNPPGAVPFKKRFLNTTATAGIPRT